MRPAGWALLLTLLLAACGPGDDDVPTQAELGDVVVAYLDVGPGGGGGHGELAVRGDGRAATLRNGERVVLTLSAEEVGRLRAELLDHLGRRAGTIDRTGGATDQPFTVVTVVDDRQRVHHVRYEGADREDWFAAAADRLGSLTERVRAGGEVDPAAPIVVTLRTDEHADPARRGDWPRGIDPPDLSSAWIGYAEYEGEQAALLRDALGPAGDDVLVRLPGGSSAIASWTALLTGS